MEEEEVKVSRKERRRKKKSFWREREREVFIANGLLTTLERGGEGKNRTFFTTF